MVEGSLPVGRPGEGSILACEPHEWDNNGRILIYKMSIKISKTKEGLDLLQRSWNQPIMNNMTLGRVHRDTIGRNNKTEVLNSISVELTLFRLHVQMVIMKMLKNLADMNTVFHHRGRKNQNIIQIHHDTDVGHIMENILMKC